MTEKKSFSNFVEKRFDLLETIFVIMVSVSLFLLTQMIKYSAYITMGSLALLAILYWAMTLKPADRQMLFVSYTRKLIFLSYCISCVAIITKINLDENYTNYAYIALAMCAANIILTIIHKTKYNQEKKFKAHIIRSLIFALVLWFLI